MNRKSDTGWTRVIHFSDKRPPHLLQFSLERELMVLFTARMHGNELRMNARSNVNGAHYQFELRFIAATSAAYHFALHTQASWADTNKIYHEYFQKSSDSWFQMWTRTLIAEQPPDPNQNLSARYQQECETTLQAQRHLDSVAAVQQAIIEGMKRGGTFSTAHKEGGAKVYWEVDHFVHAEYGDYSSTSVYRKESEFLAMLKTLMGRADQQGLTELDTWKLILRQMNDVVPPHPDDLRSIFGVIATHTPKLNAVAMMPLYSTPLAKWLILGLLFIILAALATWQFVSIQSTGTPLGSALRTETHIFQLINTQERYLPSLHRNPSKDRYRIDLLVIPLDDPSKQTTFTLIRQQQANALTPMTKILGVDGDVVWIQALDLFAVNLRTSRIASGEDLGEANPELASFLNSARPEFKDQLMLVSPEWTQAYAFTGETLKATPCQPPLRDSWIKQQSMADISNHLSAGGMTWADEWIAVATPEQAKSDFKEGFSLSSQFTATEKDRQYQLYRGSVGFSKQRRPIKTVEKLSEKQYRAANFLHDFMRGHIVRASQPDSAFLIHRNGTELFAPYTLTRLALDGSELWNTASALGRLDEVLLGNHSIVLKGERTPVQNKVSEPIMIIINVTNGSSQTVSLWR